MKGKVYKYLGGNYGFSAQQAFLGYQAYLINYDKDSNSFYSLANYSEGVDHNVGIAGPTGVMEDLSIDDWKQTIDINLNSHFYFTKFAIPLLKKNQGGIIE